MTIYDKIKLKKNCKIWQRNAEIRGVEILKNIPLHLEGIQKLVLKPAEESLVLEAGEL